MGSDVDCAALAAEFAAAATKLREFARIRLAQATAPLLTAADDPDHAVFERAAAEYRDARADVAQANKLAALVESDARALRSEVVGAEAVQA